MNRIADPLSFTYAPTSASSPNSFISSSSLPPDSSLLVTDTLDSPAHFLLLQLVSNALRPSGAGRGALRELDERRRVVILGVKEREEYWASLLKKSVSTKDHAQCPVEGRETPCFAADPLRASCRAFSLRQNGPKAPSSSSTVPLRQKPPHLF